MHKSIKYSLCPWGAYSLPRKTGMCTGKQNQYQHISKGSSYIKNLKEAERSRAGYVEKLLEGGIRKAGLWSMHRSPTDRKKIGMSVQEIVSTYEGVLWEMKSKLQMKPRSWGLGSLQMLGKFFDLGLWNNGSSNLFRNREPGSLWALHWNSTSDRWCYIPGQS